MKTHFTAKALIVCFIFSLSANEMQAQSGQWTWMKGDSISNLPSVYGVKGVASPTNRPGGRSAAINWTDLAGNLWIYGGIEGVNSTGDLKSDLWKYNTSTNEWTWVNGDTLTGAPPIYGTMGVSSAATNPGVRYECPKWIDKSGNLWLFGGNDLRNDLWKYTPSNNRWTWMKGDSITSAPASHGIQGVASITNNPAGRSLPMNWVDTSGNFWMFDGTAWPSFGNELWKYNPSTNIWTWVKGDSLEQKGVYGIRGVSSPDNHPGTRIASLTWTDNSGDLWFFGGDACYTQENGCFNDMWKYHIASNEWTWMQGDSVTNLPAVWGTKGVSSPYNKPQGRAYATGWKDRTGNLWLFGGEYSPCIGTREGPMNNLWRYNTAANEWTWVKGDTAHWSIGSYGIQGITYVNNEPRARMESSGWVDATGTFWLFGGGKGYGQFYQSGYLNDLWRYTPDTTNILPVHLLTFTAQLQDKQTHLHWTVENEQNFDRYQIERSSNGKDFTANGSVKAIHARQYSFVDKNPTNQQTTPNNILPPKDDRQRQHLYLQQHCIRQSANGQ